MLHHLQLRNTGPAPALQLELAPRLNLITGDNSLGKSFLLDVAWYCLTRRWPQELNPALSGGAMAQPTARREPAEISFSVAGDSDLDQARTYQCSFQLEEEAWVGQAGRPVNPGLVVYGPSTATAMPTAGCAAKPSISATPARSNGRPASGAPAS